ncbi:hypothetical protein MKY25_16025 [Geobacillus sp. FSL W8-0032]|uniref:Spore coat protein n=1 Tax=Geobacillus icigianus TaxID=1430331 RepID=A0ABU6BGK2_9BACL|nr:hypothetical protein [Geobacillus icigianus]MEB3751078.1 hypothetical protein [Geobacillus icigianus]
MKAKQKSPLQPAEAFGRTIRIHHRPPNGAAVAKPKEDGGDQGEKTIYISCNFVFHGVVRRSCHGANLSGDKMGHGDRRFLLSCNFVLQPADYSDIGLYLDETCNEDSEILYCNLYSFPFFIHLHDLGHNHSLCPSSCLTVVTAEKKGPEGACKLVEPPLAPSLDVEGRS